MVILVGSNKGGCGKYTTIVNLAVKFAQEKLEVLVIDAYRQSTASKWSSDREHYDLGFNNYVFIIIKCDIILHI